MSSIERATSLYDLSKQRLGVVEAVALLVRGGWDAEYVLDLPIDVFNELVLVVQKQNIMFEKTISVLIMSSIGALFSKDGGKKVLNTLDSGADKIDGLINNSISRNVTAVVNNNGDGGKRVRDVNSGARMVNNFHEQFRNWMQKLGVSVPPVNDVLRKRDELHKAQVNLPVIKKQGKKIKGR